MTSLARPYLTVKYGNPIAQHGEIKQDVPPALNHLKKRKERRKKNTEKLKKSSETLKTFLQRMMEGLHFFALIHLDVKLNTLQTMCISMRLTLLEEALHAV